MTQLTKENSNKLRKILAKNHKGERILEKINLSCARLYNKKFRNVTFNYVQFYYADLEFAEFVNCKFNNCNFRLASLKSTKIDNCKFYNTHFNDATFRYARVQNSCFMRSNFTAASFHSSTINAVEFLDCYGICPTSMLLAYWGVLSVSLTKELMRYDAENHPNSEKFREWAETGNCPYTNCAVSRVALFAEGQYLYKHSKKRALPAYELMLRLFKERKIKLEGNLH